MPRPVPSEKISLTDTDRKILDILSLDGSISYAALGAAVGLSSTGAHERVKRLKEQGVIKRIAAVIEPRKIDRSFLCFVRLKLSDVDKRGKAEQLMKISEIEEIHNIAGEYSILCKIRSKDTEHMEQVYNEIYKIPGVVQSETTVVFGTFLEQPMRLSSDEDDGAEA
ncbi:Lrp/AsnC family transcriptional regulator [Roseibium aestuarii]|uniref:Lrp/AsnC family transcriptional regulator n=1 Tax=Roseibium aestuarii TaxID=2600299 RepID=A0ABW4JY10_9HYPH|nr:Lrp/AsnC family transcriptional regulator [Roseibium aestuarii]